MEQRTATAEEKPQVRTVLSEPAMAKLARHIAPGVSAPFVLFFRGELGAGKTTFIRSLIQALGHPGRVKSPTYGLLEHYVLPTLQILHLDLYRIGDPDEVDYLGLADMFDENTVLIVEWPERGRGALPRPDLTVALDSEATDSLDKRRLSFYAHSRSGNELCEFIDSQL